MTDPAWPMWSAVPIIPQTPEQARQRDEQAGHQPPSAAERDVPDWPEALATAAAAKP